MLCSTGNTVYFLNQRTGLGFEARAPLENHRTSLMSESCIFLAQQLIYRSHYFVTQNNEDM